MSQNDENVFLSKLAKFGKAAWAYIKHAKIELLVLAGVLVLDLVTKAIIGGTMYEGQSITLIPNFLHITYVRNTKAAFGSAFGLENVLGDGAIRIIFLIITLIAMVAFSYILYRCRKRHLLMRLSIALILAGALGNFIDRAALHYVRDFIEFEYFGCTVFGSTSFPVFNVADIGLTVGVVIFLIYFIAIYKDPKKKPVTQTETVVETPQNAEDSENDALSEVETNMSCETEKAAVNIAAENSDGADEIKADASENPTQETTDESVCVTESEKSES